MADKRVEYTIGVKNEGLENLTRVIDELDKAGVETTEFKRQAEQLRQQLADMARQQSLIDSFVKIKQETVAAGAAFEAAQAKAQQLGRELAATDAPTKKQTAEFGRAREAVNSAKDAYQAAQLRLQAMRGTLAENNIETTALAQKQVALRNGVREVDASVAGATARLKAIGEDGPRAVNDTAAATDRAAASTKDYQGALTQVAGAVAGAFAVGKLADYARSVNDVADQYKNLEARVRLAVGAQGDLQSTVAGIGQVAKDTYSNLDATAELFGRLAASGKELNITNAEALGITKTINQAIQVSGASAQASEASVRQLVQALQSGTLRGDEFNSIMEQAPRLAKALADGLNVPVGALRGMAEQGELTSARVVKALKGQADAINQEFSTLPLTTGRALENLNTQWTLFIGNLTGGAQQSSVVAQGINALADNLDTLAGVAARAGTVLTAALAVQGVQALRAFAVEMVATGKAASLLSLELSKVPKVINITVAAVGLEVGYQIGTMLYENTELARKLGVGIVGYMQATVSSLQLIKEAAAAIFTSDTIDAAFARFEERNQSMRDTIAAMWKDAEQAPSQIGAAADSAGAKVDAMGSAATAAGQATAAAGAAGAAGVAGIAKAADEARGALAALVGQLSAPVPANNQFNDVLKGLQDAKKQGVDLEAFLREKLPTAIEKLSGPELMKFRNEFSVAMIEAKASGKELEAGLGLIGVQAAKSLGVDAVAASSQLGAEFLASKKKLDVLIMTLPDLKAAGVDTAAVVGEAMGKMIDSAKNQAEIDALKIKIEQMRKVLGDKITDGLLYQATDKARALKAALDDAVPGISNVEEAMRKLGVTSDATLKATAESSKAAYDALAQSGQASARELSAAFARAAQDAIAANNGVAPSWVEAQAAVRGYAVETGKAGDAVKSLADTTSAATSSMSDGFGNVSNSVRQTSQEIEQLRQRQQQVQQDLLRRYGRPGEGTPDINSPDRKSTRGEKMAEGVQEIGTGGYQFRNAQGMTSDAKGNVQQQFVWTRTTIIDYLKEAGLAQELAERLSKQFLDAQGNVPYTATGAQLKWGGQYSTLSEALGKMAEYYKYDTSGKHEAAQMLAYERGNNPSAPAPAPVTFGNSAFAPGATYVSNITIPGVVANAQIRYADAESQRNAENLLRQLAQAKGAAI